MGLQVKEASHVSFYHRFPNMHRIPWGHETTFQWGHCKAHLGAAGGHLALQAVHGGRVLQGLNGVLVQCCQVPYRQVAGQERPPRLQQAEQVLSVCCEPCGLEVQTVHHSLKALQAFRKLSLRHRQHGCSKESEAQACCKTTIAAGNSMHA